MEIDNNIISAKCESDSRAKSSVPLYIIYKNILSKYNNYLNQYRAKIKILMRFSALHERSEMMMLLPI